MSNTDKRKLRQLMMSSTSQIKMDLRNLRMKSREILLPLRSKISEIQEKLKNATSTEQTREFSRDNSSERGDDSNAEVSSSSRSVD